MRTSPSKILGAALAVFGLILGPTAQAASSTLTGANVSWNNALSWVGGVLPSAGDDIVIPDTTANNSLTVNDAAHTIGNLQFGTTGTRTTAFTINGNTTAAGAFALTITNGIVANGALATANGNLITKLPIIVQGDQTWSVGGSIPATTSDYGLLLTVGANGIQRPLTLNGKLTKTGSGELVMIGQNVGNGDIVVNQGWLKLNGGSSSLVTVGGTGSITVNSGATFMLAKNSGSLSVTKAINLNNGATFRMGGNSATLNSIGAPITFNGNVPMIADYASLLFDFTNTWSGTVTSTITGNGGTITLWDNDSSLAGIINNNGTFKMRFGTANSASAAVAWGLNNAAAYYEIYGSATNISLGSLGGTAGTVRNSNTNGDAATVTVGALNTSTTFGGTLADNAGQLGLTKVGTGTLTLTGANSYNGNTVISNGTLALQGNGTTGPGPVLVNGGTTLSGSGTAGAVTVFNNGFIQADGGAGAPPLNMGSLTLGTTGTDQTTTRVNAYLGGKVAASGVLTVNGTNQIDIIGAAPAVGVYDLISYTGSIGGAGFAGFKLGAVPFGVAAVLQDSGTAVQLNITAITVESSVWVGNVVSAWNLDGGLEWKGASSGNPQPYHDLYPAFFDDSATSFTVNVTTNVVPAVVGINNTTHNYTFTGSGGISGSAPVAKDGTGTVIFANSNSYTGGTFLTNGVLQVGNGGTNGSFVGPIMDNGALVFNRSDSAVYAGAVSGTGTVEQRGPGVLTFSGNNSFLGITTISAGTLATGSGTALGDTNVNTVIANGATLDVNAQNLGMEPISVQGAGVGGAGAIVNNTADNQNALRYVTLTGPTTFGGSFRWDIRDPAPANDQNGGVNAFLVGNGNNLTKVGTNVFAFINAGDLGLADINIMAGTMTFSRSTFPGNSANKITVYPGATLQFHRTSEYLNNVINKVLVMTNGNIAIESNGLTNWFSGPVTLNGSNTVTVPSSTTGLVLEGPVGGGGSLTANLVGGILSLSGNCNYSGGTTINGGVLQVDGTLGTGSLPLVLANAALTGSGTINDPVTVPAGSTLAPGVFDLGRLTINNSLVLAVGCTNRFEINKDAGSNDNVVVSGSLTYGGNLVLSNLGSAYAPGDSFKLFNAASYSGAFSSINPPTPGLGLLWVTNSLNVDGTVKVILVPTPTPPIALSASSLVTNAINVIYSLPVDPATSQDLANYQLSTTNIILSATQISDTNILLALDSPLLVSNYTLHVQGVKNLNFVPDTIVATNVPGKTFGFEQAVNIIISPTDGQAFASGDMIHIFASGADIFNATDQFEFVYKTVTNDFDYSVCLVSEGQSDPAAKAGLMVREMTDPSAPATGDRNVMVASFPPAPGRNQNLFQYRETTDGTAVGLAAPRPDSTFPTNWLRLTRNGAIFSGYYSSNSLDWVFMGSLDTSTNAAGAYGSEVRIGLAVTSHNIAIVNEAVFSNFGVARSRVPLSVAISGGNVVLSWPAPGLGMILQATPSLTPPITWTNVPDTTATNLIVLPLGSGESYFRLTQ